MNSEPTPDGVNKEPVPGPDFPGVRYVPVPDTTRFLGGVDGGRGYECFDGGGDDWMGSTASEAKTGREDCCCALDMGRDGGLCACTGLRTPSCLSSSSSEDSLDGKLAGM